MNFINTVLKKSQADTLTKMTEEKASQEEINKALDAHKTKRDTLIGQLNEINEEQKNRFAGNMLQVAGDKNYLVMSNSAFSCLNQKQKSAIVKYCEILYSSLDIIEACGGGSARCMMAEVFLPKKI